MRNQIDLVKNEMAKAKAEWEREKKKINSDNNQLLEQTKREFEDLVE